MRKLLSLACVSTAAWGGSFAWHERDAAHLELTEDGRTVFVYNHGAGRECCYLHPVASPAGVVLTDDGPGDHKHHRGVFWAWPVVETGGTRFDLWTRKDVEQRFERIIRREATGEGAKLTVQHSWIAGGRRIVKETLSLAVHPAQGSARVMDASLTLEAVDQPVDIAGAPENGKGYGGFSCRFAPRSGTVIRASEGPVDKDEDHGKHTWAELEATFGSRRAGLRIASSDANGWCLRYYGFVGANFPGVVKHRLETGKPLTLRYQLKTFDGGSIAEENGRQFERGAAAMDKLMRAWLGEADPRTGLLPERIRPGDKRRYTPHNSGADLYPYLILTAELTDPALYRGRMMEMLRNEIRYTTVADSLPGDLDFETGKLGPLSLFGASEYAKDGLLAVTELLGRTPWFYRMADITAEIMKHAPVKTRWENLPGADAEINGDVLQTLVRLIPMTNDPRYLAWARQIADAYVQEVLPGCHGLPCMKWNFETHQGDGKVQLRDHGNETVVGLVLLYALEEAAKSERAATYRPVIRRMLDRILDSANPDGLLYDAIDPATLKPVRTRLSDNWGYVYGAAYAYYQATGETKYRDAVRRVLSNLPKYRRYDWENGSFDGVADSVESALYLVNREPSQAAWDWIDAEMEDLLSRQLPSGFIEFWYGEGNFNRTVYLWALAKSQGCRPAPWTPGLQIGAVRDGDGLALSLNRDAAVRFDFARHRRVMNYAKNYVRLNEFPEWFTVDENRLYRLRGPKQEEMVRLGSELVEGVRLASGQWEIQPWK